MPTNLFYSFLAVMLSVGVQLARSLEASQAETQAAKLSTEAVAAEKAQVESAMSRHGEEHDKLNQASKHWCSRDCATPRACM